MPLREWLNRRKAPSRTGKQQIGDQGEQRAMLHLQQAGLLLVERNFLCKGGEIDLIMQDRGALVFVEVRARASAQYGGAISSVTPAKQRRLILAAQVYLQRFRHPPSCRFDLVAIENGSLHWLQDVISAS
jgi:putative endonuclease